MKSICRVAWFMGNIFSQIVFAFRIGYREGRMLRPGAMALSNIFREPRREITESAVGVSVFLVFIWFDSLFAHWFYGVTERIWPGQGCPVPLGYFLGLLTLLISTILVVGLSLFTHFLGEELCDFMANRGLELRPKQRFN